MDKEYTIDVSDGMFVVAYPNENKDTEFEFEYWVDTYDKTVWDLVLEFDFNGPMGKQARVIVIIAFVFIFLIITCIIGCIFKCLKKSR